MNDSNLLDFNEQLAVERVRDKYKCTKPQESLKPFHCFHNKQEIAYLKNQDYGKLTEHFVAPVISREVKLVMATNQGCWFLEWSM